jgi:hypothetical protein
LFDDAIGGRLCGAALEPAPVKSGTKNANLYVEVGKGPKVLIIIERLNLEPSS